MLDRFDYGLNRAIEEMIGGLLIPILVSIFVSTGHIPSYFIWLLHFVNIFDAIVLIQKMPYWASSYSVGWLVGLFILAGTDLLTIIDIGIYLIPLVILLYRLKNYFSRLF